MPNWKKLIYSGSAAVLSNVSASSYTGSFSGSFTGSLTGTITSASFASTASFVNTLNQSVLITSSLTIGTSSLGANENTLVLGPAPAGGTGEGGQLLLQAPGGTYTSASMWDNWQNYTRLLRGTNASSDAVVAQFNMHSKQVSFPAYNGVSAFVGTAVANLAVDSNGNILTVSTSGGTVFPYVGAAVISGSLIVTGSGANTGSISAFGPIYSLANGAMYFRGGDDAEFWDINVANTVGIYGQQDATIASIKLGSGGGTLSGRSGNIGVGTTTPNSGALHVNGGVFATSLTGSLFGTSSWSVSSSSAISSSWALSSSAAISSSWALSSSRAISSSYALSASFSISSSRTVTSSYSLTATSASYAPTNTLQFNNQGASYTLVITDVDKLIEINSGAPNTLTVPENSTVQFPVGTQIMIVQQGAGQTTISPASVAVTLNSAGGLLNLANQYSAATLVKRAVDEWYVFGDLA